MIRIAIAEDIERIFNTLKNKIELSKDFQVVEWCKTGKEMLHKIQQGLEVDVILMDIEMPEMNGIEATSKIIANYPYAKILMCSVYDDEQHLFEAIMAGAKGYILKDETPEKVHRSLFETLEGGSAMSSSMALKALNIIKNGKPISEKEDENTSNLTKRELEIVELLAKGLSYERVSDTLGISYGTTRKHIENIYRKLNVHSKLDAINKLKNNNF